MLPFIIGVAWPENILTFLEMEVRFGQLPFMLVYLTLHLTINGYNIVSWGRYLGLMQRKT